MSFLYLCFVIHIHSISAELKFRIAAVPISLAFGEPSDTNRKRQASEAAAASAFVIPKTTQMLMHFSRH